MPSNTLSSLKLPQLNNIACRSSPTMPTHSNTLLDGRYYNYGRAKSDGYRWVMNKKIQNLHPSNLDEWVRNHSTFDTNNDVLKFRSCRGVNYSQDKRNWVRNRNYDQPRQFTSEWITPGSRRNHWGQRWPLCWPSAQKSDTASFSMPSRSWIWPGPSGQKYSPGICERITLRKFCGCHAFPWMN